MSLEDYGVAMVAPSVAAKKKYKCPYCDGRFERPKLPIHIQDKHEDLIPEGYTALRVAFNTINHKTEGHCIICKDVTRWNEDKGRYERLCDKPACHEAYKKMVAERNRNKYGTDRLQTDPKYKDIVERKALANRKISGIYKFPDGGEIQYVGSYEKKCLEFMDKVMHCESTDIIAPGPSIEYEFEGKKHLYLPDFYYEPYNLIIEIKDGGSNPNNHPKRLEEEAKIKAKESAIVKLKDFSYVRVVNNNFGQLLSIMAVLKYQLLFQKYYVKDPIIRVNEDMSGTIGAALAPSPMPYEADKNNYYIIQHPENNVFNYEITKDPVQNTIYGVDPEEKGFYKAYKSDKSKISKKYLTFKIKDNQKAKELYDELALLSNSGKPFADEECQGLSYIYKRLTEGSEMLTPDQLLFDDRFELVRSISEETNQLCEQIYDYLTDSLSYNMNLLEEQIDSLGQESGEEFYNVLPPSIDNLNDLMAWKDKFFSMPYQYRITSNDKSIALYGLNNITRFNNKYAELAGEVDPNSTESVPTNEGSTEISSEFYDGWAYKIQRAREAESMGMIIMVNTDSSDNLSNGYNESIIEKLKRKWDQLQSISPDKRVLSNQTAYNIFGIDNDGIYARILGICADKLQTSLNNIERPVDTDVKSIDLVDAQLSPNNSYFTPEDNIDHLASNTKIDTIMTPNEAYTNSNYRRRLLNELTQSLRNTSNPEKRLNIKSQIYDLGWNPEIPYSESVESLINLRYQSFLSLQEVDAEEYLKERDSVQLESHYTYEQVKDKIAPIYIVLCQGVSLFSKSIMWFTDSDWSHATLSFDTTLDKMYTFNVDNDNGLSKKFHAGFGIDNKAKWIKANPQMKIKVYALFITPEQKSTIQDAVQWYIDNMDQTSYNFGLILNIIMRRASEKQNKGSMICSQFVYSLLQLVDFKLKKTKDASLVTPRDIDELSNDARFFVLYQGGIDQYNKFKTDALCRKIIPTLPMKDYGINESTGARNIWPISALDSTNSDSMKVSRVFHIADEIFKLRKA